MRKKNKGKAAEADEALSALEHSLDGAKRLVERTRFLLSGDALAAEDALVVAAAAQAAAPSTSDTVQNPSGE